MLRYIDLIFAQHLLQEIRVDDPKNRIDMSLEDIEIVLSRHWASNLNTPVFLVDSVGNLIFINEAAEPLLGFRFAEIGEIGAEFWATAFSITDERGDPIPAEEQPLAIALSQQKPAHRKFNAIGLDGIKREIEATCFPLINSEGNFFGVAAMFWHTESTD